MKSTKKHFPNALKKNGDSYDVAVREESYGDRERLQVSIHDELGVIYSAQWELVYPDTGFLDELKQGLGIGEPLEPEENVRVEKRVHFDHTANENNWTEAGVEEYLGFVDSAVVDEELEGYIDQAFR